MISHGLGRIPLEFSGLEALASHEDREKGTFGDVWQCQSLWGIRGLPPDALGSALWLPEAYENCSMSSTVCPAAAASCAIFGGQHGDGRASA